MSVMESDLFDHPIYQQAPVTPTIPSRGQQQQILNTHGSSLVNRTRSGKRSAFKKRDVLNSWDENHDMMGQSESAEYIDVFDVNPHHPPIDDGANQFDVSMRSHNTRSVRGGGDQTEESEDYSYAYSSQISRESIGRLTGPPTPRLRDDYSVPPDRLSVTSGGVQLASPDYIEPYKSHADTKDASASKQLDDSDSGDIYELAKDIDAIHAAGSPSTIAQSAVNRDSQYSHLNSTSAQFKFPQSSVTCITEESYDHLNSWQPKCNPVNLETDLGNQIPVEVQNSNSTHSASVLPPMMQQPGEYQEPWDSEEGKLRLSQIMQKAEQRDGQRKSSTPAVRSNAAQRAIPAENPQPTEMRIMPPVAALQTLHRPAEDSEESNTYESAWDNEKHQRKFSGLLQTAQNKGACTPPAPLPKQNKGACTPPAPLPKPGMAYSHDPATHTLPKAPDDYEEAWDLPEKQKEFEETLALARKQREYQRKVSEAGAGTGTVAEQVPARVRAPAEPPPRTPSPTLSPGFSRIHNRHDVGERVARSDSCRSLGALAEKVDSTVPLEDQNFYHGSIKRSEAERMLVVFKDGSYLVRRSESKKQDFSLTLKGWNGLAMHMKISHRPDGTYILGENSQPFPSVSQMIHFYTTHELPVHNAERICLLYPIPC